MTPDKDTALAALERWYAGLEKDKDGLAKKGPISAALVVLERLKDTFTLDVRAYKSANGFQVKGLSGRAVARILAAHGEERQFSSEGGRTNRGSLEAAERLLETLRPLNLHTLPEEELDVILYEMQEYLVERVKEFHERQRVEMEYDQTKTIQETIRLLLEKARQTNKAGAVAQHLVGAKLERRFENMDITIPNHSYTTADVPTGRSGDFPVKDTVFHVTVAPQSGVYDKCAENLRAGLRVYLLVPDDRVLGARQLADQFGLRGRIAVEAIETFVGQNIEELSTFSKDRLIEELYHLLETYNRRVDAIEYDKSIMIEIPQNLLPRVADK